MNYGQIRKYDVANGTGIRTTIFVTGCTHNCRNCFNKEYQDFKAGNTWTEKETKQVIKYLSDPNVKGLSLLGGEPFQNLWLIDIIKEIKPYLRENQDIWVWSGYTFEEIVSRKQRRELLSLCDILVDGKFIEELKDLKLKFRGSSNQRIIEISKSLQENRPILSDLN